VYHHHYNHGGRNRGWNGGNAALGAIIGLGAGVAIGSALAAPPPPPVVIYQQPPVVYAPPQGQWVQPPPYWVPR
jgi:hypothetical protein